MANDSTGLLRPHYFERQQLSAADLKKGQDYLRERLRRHNRFLHGWGVVCGAEVSVTGNPWEVRVSEGYVLTSHGDEVYIPPGLLPFNIETLVQECMKPSDPCVDSGDLDNSAETQCVDFTVFKPGTGPNPRTEQGITFTVPYQYQTQIGNLGSDYIGLIFMSWIEISLPVPTTMVELALVFQGWSVTVKAYNADGSIAGEISMKGPQYKPKTFRITGTAITRVVVEDTHAFVALLLNFCLVPVVSDTVYLVVCPLEEQICPQPAVPADCQPPGGSYEFSRIRETYQFDIKCSLPASDQNVFPSCEELAAIVCGQAHVQCPQPLEEDDNCVVLATITVGQDSILNVDDFSNRRRLLSEALQLAYLRCQCEQALQAFKPPAGLDPAEFDIERGAKEPVEKITDIGEVRGHKLREAGIHSVLAFTAMPVERAAEILAISEAGVAEMQAQARDLMRR